MEQLDLLIRGAAIGVTALVAARPLWRGPDRRKALSVAALGLAVICYLLVSVPALRGLVGPVIPLLVLGANLAPAALTWAVLEIFFDRPGRQRAWLVLAGAVFVAAYAATVWPAMAVARGVLVAALYAGLIVLAVRTDADDLVEGRRRFRRVFVAAMGLVGVAITAVELAVDPAGVPAWLFPLQAGAVLALSAAFGFWTLDPANPLWPPAQGGPPSRTRPTGLADRVLAAMEAGAWRREGLTIAALAADLGLTEPRLRAVINGELGHRNFSAFVNGYRIEAARAALADPARARATVLEIAYEVGFASLGPFNRAFRAGTGQSPTEYRKARLG